MKLIKAIAFFLLIFLSQAEAVYATSEVPPFSNCPAPAGELKVSYETGFHGIPGNTSTFEGSDRVYTLNDSQLVQCFCPKDEGAGIQTFWWKVASLSESDLNIFKNQGWNYVPNGMLWGLSSDPYLTLNSSYACRGGNQGQIASSVLFAPDKSVLGLANTGGTRLFLGVLGLGAVTFVLGLILRKNFFK